MTRFYPGANDENDKSDSEDDADSDGEEKEDDAEVNCFVIGGK